jgi:cell division protein FtsQ
VAARKRTTARAAVLPGRRRALPELRSFVPSGRSIVVGVVLLLLGAAAYAGARETSVFALRRIEVTGASPRVRAEVLAALAAERGRSLLVVGTGDLDRRLAGVPDVLAADYDRAFPHTLRVTVVPERPVILLRRGDEGWVVSATGRVLRSVRNTRPSRLPRVWVTLQTAVAVGRPAPRDGIAAAAAIAVVRPGTFPGGVRFLRSRSHELTFVLGSGFEVRLGDLGDLRLKLAIARRLVTALGPDRSGYVDVSVPERPVATTDSQVEG